MKNIIILLYFLITIALTFSSCKKDPKFIPDNDAPYYGKHVPTVLVENYVNRLFIDLIGREPLDVEMELEVNALKKAELNVEARKKLISKLQEDTTFVEGDISYKHAYYRRLYDLTKVRLLEGASNDDLQGDINNFRQAAIKDSLNGNMVGYQINMEKLQKLQDVIDSEMQYFEGEIELAEMYARMLDNSIYDKINMNTFNFINASFDNLFFRFPTESEFYEAFDMVEYDQSGVILGKSGQSKNDYLNILVNSREFYEGLIRWSYLTLLAREPTSLEEDELMSGFYSDHDFQQVQMSIMISDEYANF